MLTIWGRKTSSNVQALMWCVGALKLQYRRIDVGHHFGGTDTPEFLRLNPNGTIPVLQDGDGPPLWETASILRYLASRYGGDGFWPQDLGARTEVDRWAEWAKLNVAMLFTVPLFWRLIRTPPDQIDHHTVATALRALETKLAIANTQLERHAFLAGDDFSLADVQFGHVLYRYYDLDIARADLPALRAYYDQLTLRPAYQEHVMLSYEDLRAQ